MAIFTGTQVDIHNLALPGGYNPTGWTGNQGVDFTGVVWGSPIPISKGYRKVTGVPIWAGAPVKHITNGHLNVNSDGTWTRDLYWEYQQTFAISLGYKLRPEDTPQVRRIWSDGQLMWSNGVGAPVTFGGLNQDYTPGGVYYNGVWVFDQNDPTGGGANIFRTLLTGTGPVVPIQSNLKWRFHNGAADQMPDEAVVADLGVLAPAFRNMMYLVIEGLVVGKGFQMENSREFVVNSDGSQTFAPIHTQETTAPQGFPLIEVELVDGQILTISNHDFTMASDSLPIENPDHTIEADWATRELAMVTQKTGGGGYLRFFDIATATESAFIPVTGLLGTDRVGQSDNVFCWDHVNDLFYTTSDDFSMLCINRAGEVVSTAMPQGTPENVDGNTSFTVAKPAIQWPTPLSAGLSYAIQNGLIYPILMASNQSNIGFFSPKPDGTLSTFLRPEAIEDSGLGMRLYACLPLPTLKDGVNNSQPYQDVAFVCCFNQAGIPTDPPRVVVYYVSCYQEGGPHGTNFARVLGSRTIWTGSSATQTVAAILDVNGNICIQEKDLSRTPVFHMSKYAVIYGGTVDTTNAPGWRGRFPEIGALTLDDIPTGEDTDWKPQSARVSDVSQGYFSSSSRYEVNLNDGSVIDMGISGDSLQTVWDDRTKTRFYHASLADSAFGHGMRYIQVLQGIDGNLAQLDSYIGGVANYIGFEDDQISIDASLTDNVPGLLITHPYDLASLYNDMGELYTFTYFNSGDQLRFASASNNPGKATGTYHNALTGTSLGLSNNVSDGDTVTIGTFVYRFKHTPSAPFDVKLELDTNTAILDAREKTVQNLFGAIMGDLTLCSDTTAGFFAGTTTHTKVTAKIPNQETNYGVTHIIVTARVGGTVGNAIVTTVTGGGHGFGHGTLTDGVEPPAPAVSITRDDMALATEDTLTDLDALVTTISPQGKAQQAASVKYWALEQDYLPTSQTYIPDDLQGNLDQTGATTAVYDVPFVLSTSDAYARVSKTAIRNSDNVIVQNYRLPQAFLRLEPGDVIQVTFAPYEYLLRTDEATLNGDFSISFSATNYSFRNDVDVANSDVENLPQTVPGPSDGLPIVLDMPFISPGYANVSGYVNLFDGIKAYAHPFTSAALYGGHVIGDEVNLAPIIPSTSRDTPWATLLSTMPTAVEPYYLTVEDSITLSLKTMSTDDLASAGYYDFVAGVNCLVIGAPGRWEYVFFRDVTVLTTKSVTLTGLIRGQRGTDPFVNTHLATDLVFLVASASATFTPSLATQSIVVDRIGETYRYLVDGTPAGRNPVSADYVITGYSLYPFTPCLLGAVLAGGNDINLSWVRRDKAAVEFVTVDQTLSEASEEYEVDIYSGVTIVRTVTGLTSPAYTYSSANQVTDGFTPPLATLKIAVYQVSAEVGRGFGKTETLNVL